MIDRDISSAENLFASLKGVLAHRDGDEYDEAWQDARHELISKIHGWCIDESLYKAGLLAELPTGPADMTVITEAGREALTASTEAGA